jgi:hypothetical protein
VALRPRGGKIRKVKQSHRSIGFFVPQGASRAMTLPLLGTLPCLMTHIVLMNAKTPCSRNSHLTREGTFARVNYYAAQGLLWASLAASSLAALLGLVPSLSAAIEKWQLGLASALSVLLTTFSQQLGFQQRANWHYRKVHRIRTLRRRLQFELPTSPTADDIASVSNARSAMDLEMSGEWEDMKWAREP